MKSFKSFKEWLFPNIFTQYHKDYDTYKDAQGKGILERFVEICGEYFDNEVVPEIDNIVDSLIDYDKNSAIYINYLWEMFGSFPYAYGVIVGIETPTKENIQKWIQEDDHYPRADFRKLMRYILQLYRIRGSQLFFTVVGRLFNVEITVKELSSGLEDLEEADSYLLAPGVPAVVEEGDDNGYIVAVYLDPEALDDKDNQHLVYSIYDPTSQVKAVWGQDCNSCKEVSVDIKFPSSLQETLFNGKQLNDAGKKAYNDFIRLIEKYLPINVRISETERTYGLIPDSVLSPIVTQLPSYNQQTTELFGGEFGFPVTIIAEVIFNNNGVISTKKQI